MINHPNPYRSPPFLKNRLPSLSFGAKEVPDLNTLEARIPIIKKSDVEICPSLLPEGPLRNFAKCPIRGMGLFCLSELF
jgi:hypothetical protein